MPNKRIYHIALAPAVCLLMLLALQVALAEDDRINQVHHFGGDALYCDEDSGCWLLDMNGNLLWEVPQEEIDEAMAAACETGMTQSIEAGMGTYGPSVIRVSCYEGYDPFLTYVGYDEWGKLNEMRFSPSYEPVNAPPETEPEPEPVVDPCSIPLFVSGSLSICPR